MLSSNYVKRVIEFIKDNDDFNLIAHYDTDGIVSLYIFKKLLDSLDKKYEFSVIPNLDQMFIESKIRENTVFLDIGSGYINTIKKYLNEKEFLIVDHHQIKGKTKYHFNPFLFGLDGNSEICGATNVNLLCNLFNMDYSDISLIGAIGDLQYPFIGKNREFFERSKIRKFKDISFFGRYSRKLLYFICYSDTPGLKENLKKTYLFLLKKNFDPNEYYFSLKNKKKLIFEIMKIYYKHDLSISKLFDEVYELDKFDIKDLKEVSSIINSCGRQGEVNSALTYLEKGNSEFLNEIRTKHKKVLKDSLNFAKNNLTQINDKIILIDGRGKIPHYAIGSICSTISRQENEKIIVGYSEIENGIIKVSIRNPNKNIDIGKWLSKNYVTGGGHKNAGGCLIDQNELEEFLTKLKKI